jgi:hypothetical protein
MSANRFLWRILEWEPRGNMKEGNIKRRWIGGRRFMNKPRLIEENTRDKDMKRNLVFVKEDHCALDCSGTNGKEVKK